MCVATCVCKYVHMIVPLVNEMYGLLFFQDVLTTLEAE